MINLILQYPLFYRLYQKTVRKNNHEYDLFKFIFSQLSKDKKLKMLDLCSGDSFVLKYVGEFIDESTDIASDILKLIKDSDKKINNIFSLENFEQIELGNSDYFETNQAPNYKTVRFARRNQVK